MTGAKLRCSATAGRKQLTRWPEWRTVRTDLVFVGVEISLGIAPLNAHPFVIRVGRFRNFDRADFGNTFAATSFGTSCVRGVSGRSLSAHLTEISKPQECSDAPPLARTMMFSFASSA